MGVGKRKVDGVVGGVAELHPMLVAQGKATMEELSFLNEMQHILELSFK